ncbi:MAG: helix-turn-helix domain-containing protein [Nanoarchaeota archaeon]
MIKEILKSIGLSQNEIKIYISLLELGPSLMGQVCGKTKIHRRNVYDSIEMLKDKGFVSSTIINNRNVFEAVNPERILDILDEKRTSIEEILPQLLGKQNQKQTFVKVYTGLNGRKIIFEDKLKHIEEQYVLGAHKPSGKISPYLENYHNRRIRKKIPTKMLFINQDKETAKKFEQYKYIEAKLLPNKFSSPIAINIYGKKTAILLGSDTTEPITILIEDEGLSNDFRMYFNMLWKISKSI